jgi:8-oxo-dGTP diphosphatase
MITVVAALIQRRGRLLICQRRAGGPFPLKWEFPGGKVQPGETPQAALRRELREELGVAARVGRQVHGTRHRYASPALYVELLFYRTTLPKGVRVRNLQFERIVWERPAMLTGYDFLPADRELVERLAGSEMSC